MVHKIGVVFLETSLMSSLLINNLYVFNGYRLGHFEIVPGVHASDWNHGAQDQKASDLLDTRLNNLILGIFQCGGIVGCSTHLKHVNGIGMLMKLGEAAAPNACSSGSMNCRAWLVDLQPHWEHRFVYSEPLGS